MFQAMATGVDFSSLFGGASESAQKETLANICESMRTPDPDVSGNIGKHPVRMSILAMHDGLAKAVLVGHLTEAIATTTFQSILRTQVVDEVLLGYGEVELVGRKLVTPSQQPGKETGTMARATTDATMLRVREGEEYPQAGLSDKKVTFNQEKWGRSIHVTKETVQADKTGTVLDTARGLGRVGAEFEEESILGTIQDVAGYEGYNPDGTQTALYAVGGAESTDQTPANNVAQTNALADWTDIDNADKLLASKLKENGKPIAASPNVALLAPRALKGTGGYILKNTSDTRDNKRANAPREVLNLPGGNHYSPFLDIQSTTTWYYGDFKRQFSQTFWWPLSTFFIPGASDSSFALRDIFGAWVVTIFFDVIARDFRFVIKNTA